MVTMKLLIGSNFKKWKEDVEFALEIANMNLAMISNKLADLVATSTNNENKAYAAIGKSQIVCAI